MCALCILGKNCTYLRTHEKTSRYISPTSLQLSEQIDWLRSYRCDTAQAYFIIERVDGTPIGTVRMYDARGPSFCWGSWILKPEEPFYHAIESAMMIYMYVRSAKLFTGGERK